MQWQESIALSIVAVTVGLFGWRRVLRKPKSGLPGCGCSGTKAKPPGVILRGRKGERSQMIIKMK